jgi:hypothetical protein
MHADSANNIFVKAESYILIIPTALYGSETWSLLLMVTGVFRPTRAEATGEWGKWINEELQVLSSSLDITGLVKSLMMG